MVADVVAEASAGEAAKALKRLGKRLKDAETDRDNMAAWLTALALKDGDRRIPPSGWKKAAAALRKKQWATVEDALGMYI